MSCKFKDPLMICEHNESTMIRIVETVTSICNVIKKNKVYSEGRTDFQFLNLKARNPGPGYKK